MSDPKYLAGEQYKDASNLDARVQLHRLFSTNPYGWHKWAFDQLDLAPESRVLELGCGPGHLWRDNLDRIPEGWEITLSDFSPGMVHEAREHLGESGRSFNYAAADAQALPFHEESFDAIIANHMLYHVPDRPRAYSEIRRALKPGGRLYASTLGVAHMYELADLVAAFDANTPFYNPQVPKLFGLENGAEQLSPYFPNVTLRRHEDSLLVTEVKPLVDYVLSSDAKSYLIGEKLEAFTRYIGEQIAARGPIHITKDSGMFLAARL
jgi:ubiquinone/menaquinone biosynthesis C-methylase UbiE